MGHSLARGVDACRKASGWLIALADMPCIEVATVRRIAAALDQPEAIVVPVYDGRRGHPVAFGSAYGETLTALTGDRGARGLLDRHRERVRELACGDPGIVFDIDTQEDIDEWRARMGSLQKK
ncbi:MAG: nucleotidyltransferase family protein [Gammaproteobacteria bacterium]|nr:nucleotidyltransferase family protein [Gammaproteobacteria bacterium]NIT64986.1 nucleotidyltransferase family protein [Gammaproteobacteria bacterium]NIV22005.1 NTP transferase domain-containing protein [Gammaproteobacteria bacterium]NIY33565.1 NTP transferase domain-containing protein [Gammaproteobacteria bacterium]